VGGKLKGEEKEKEKKKRLDPGVWEWRGWRKDERRRDYHISCSKHIHRKKRKKRVHQKRNKIKKGVDGWTRGIAR